MQFLKRFSGILVTVALVGGGLLALQQRQNIADWYRLRDYTPPAEIAALADHTKMSDYGRKLFYVHVPSLETAETFNNHCSIYEATIILGCYVTHQSIHIYDVQDDRLQGIREVTAAHEMLHAAYDRLDDSERETINAQLEAFYNSIKGDQPRLEEVIENYRERDPTVVHNELHSILPTEVRELTPALETYYQRYFDDRLAVVEYSEQYEDIFVQQQQKIQSLLSEIEALEAQLKVDKQTIDAQEAQLQASAQELETLRNQQRFAAYNARVPSYNQEVNAYRANVESYNADVVRLNDLIKQYNELAVERKSLYDAIDSRNTEL